jgi:hypothetical protein
VRNPGILVLPHFIATQVSVHFTAGRIRLALENNMEFPELSEEEIKELSRLSRYNRMGVLGYFWEISQEHHAKHEKYNQLANKEYSGDLEFQSEAYYSFAHKSQKSGYIAIVFAAMYIEAAIYNFGCIYLGDEYVKKNLDRLDPLSKLSVILRLVTEKELDSSGQAYEHVKRIFKYRNTLAHTKTRPAYFGKEAFILKEKESKHYSSAIESAKFAVKFLDEETRNLNKDEYHPGIFGHNK